jgi:glycosyltransferase A (GT-A) superfamily protein (DUF2064 family)
MIQILVLAKTPVPGRVKTRLCPPYTPGEAASLAAAALSDTIATVATVPDVHRTLVIDGDHPAPSGWNRIVQRGGSLAERLAHAYRDSRMPGIPALLIGMDTPQAGPALLTEAADLLTNPDIDAVLGLAEDGGWWALGLRKPDRADVLRDVPTSTSNTGTLTLERLRSDGLRVVALPMLRDVDTAADAAAVAALCPPESAFAKAVGG